jgi:hypothetical protein
MLRKGIALATLLMMVMGSLMIFSGSDRLSATFDPSIAKVHDPIYIEGNKNFTAANGVVGGSGTEEDPYVISDWIIVNGQQQAGIMIHNTTKHFVIRDCQIKGNGDQKNNLTYETSKALTIGIDMMNVIFGRIYQNQLYHTWAYEIFIEDCEYIEISENIFKSDKGEAGIHIYKGLHLDITYNTFDAIIDWNVKMGSPEIQFHKEDGIETVECSDLLIKGNSFIHYLDQTIISYHDEGVMIDSNKIVNSMYRGIDVKSEDVKISNNSIKDIDDSAISVHSGMNIEIMNNNCSDSGRGINVGGEGVDILLCHDNIIENNDFGIKSNRENSIFNNNSVLNSEQIGFEIYTYRNTFINNMILGNEWKGMWIYNNAFGMADDRGGNEVKWNNFIDTQNDTQAQDEDLNIQTINNSDPYHPSYEGPRPNNWSCNFWSDHISPDADSDGIVDTIYTIPGQAGSSDKLPLMEPIDIMVVGPSMIPHIMGEPVKEMDIGTNYSQKFTAVDYLLSSGSLKWSLQTNASCLSLDKDNVLRGTPDKPGVFGVKVSVQDGAEIDTKSFLLTVKGEMPDVPDDNETDPDDNQTKPDENETHDLSIYKDKPTNLGIALPSEMVVEGSMITFRASASDPDLGDKLSFMWEIVGIGTIGFGPVLNYTLLAGRYTVRLTVTDLYGNTVTTSSNFTIDKKASFERNPELNLILPLVIGVIVILGILSLFFMRKRNGPSSVEGDRSLDAPGRSKLDRELVLKPDLRIGKGSGLSMREDRDIDIPTSDLTPDLKLMERNVIKDGPSSQEDRSEIRRKADRMLHEGKISRNTHRTIARVLKYHPEE